MRGIDGNGDAEVNLRFRNFNPCTMRWKNTAYPFNFFVSLIVLDNKSNMPLAASGGSC